MDFDLRLLRHARALAEEGSFARASRTLHLTQPALSRSIQELERRTGIALFERGKGRVEPTELGRMFLAQARELLGRAEALDREVATMRGTSTGNLVVGSGTFPTAMFMGDALAAFLAKNPRVGVRLVNDNWVNLVAGLRRRELDFVVAAPPEPDESRDLAVRPLSPTQGYFLVRPGHPLRIRARPSLADVAAYPLVCTGRLTSNVTGPLLAARGAGAAARPMPDVACESTGMMSRIAATTDHVLLTALSAHARELDAGELVALPLVDPRIAVAFAILRIEARSLPPVAEALLRNVVEAARAAHELERRLAPPASGPRAVPTPKSRDVRRPARAAATG